MSSEMIVKKEEIILLPSTTFEVGNIVQHKDWENSYQVVGKILNETEFLYLNGISAQWISFFKPYHLYILSDDKIKEGDWVYCNWSLSERSIYQVKEIKSDCYIDSNNYGHLKTKENFVAKKIIATTNTDLNLPNLPLNFLEDYVINNSCKGLVKVDFLIEYTGQCKGTLKETKGFDWKLGRMMKCTQCGIEDYYNGFEKTEGCRYELKTFNPVITEHNTISFSLVKNHWSFEELRSVLAKFNDSPYIDSEDWINDCL